MSHWIATRTDRDRRDYEENRCKTSSDPREQLTEPGMTRRDHVVVWRSYSTTDSTSYRFPLRPSKLDEITMKLLARSDRLRLLPMSIMACDSFNKSGRVNRPLFSCGRASMISANQFKTNFLEDSKQCSLNLFFSVGFTSCRDNSNGCWQSIDAEVWGDLRSCLCSDSSWSSHWCCRSAWTNPNYE